jgi:alkylation response protein AidB-like acyl-CoA dehydrogenase
LFDSGDEKRCPPHAKSPPGRCLGRPLAFAPRCYRVAAMADNLFTDFPDRVAQIQKYVSLEKLVDPLEGAFGEKGTFATTAEAMEFYNGALAEIGKFCAREVMPTADEIDRQGARLVDGEVLLPEALQRHVARSAELGVFASPIYRANGGINMPRPVQLIAMEMFAHVCPNTALTLACFSMAEFVQMWGSTEQKERLIGPMIRNEVHGSMALTEAGAGSDLGKLRTSARRDGDRWIVNGTKQFITNGGGDITFALVRTDPHSTGLQGLSVLIVPRKIDGRANYRVTKLEDKICLHASPTCELTFENSIGELMGPEGSGFKVMSDLMNSARLGMAALAVGIAARAHSDATRYALERVTMGKPIAQHPMVADMLFEMDLEIRAMRAMVMEACIAFDWMQIARATGDESAFRRWKKRYRRLTPLCKYACAERAIGIARNALQIFGGYGVCRDYPMERLWRETIIYPIYEGTSQIQSLMVLKDTLKDVASLAPGFLGSLAGAWAESKVTVDPVKSVVLQARNELNQGIRTILVSIIRDKFKSDIEALKQQKIQDFIKEFSLTLLSPKTDLTVPFLCAERFTRITCDYYALKSMADRLPPGDKARQKTILDFADLALPRMRLENHYMVHRLPSTLGYMKTLIPA